MAEQTIICIGCPLGCNVTLKIDKKGEIEALTGNQCKEGKEYVIAEFRSPVRVFTATVLTETGGRLLAVRTDKPVHKGQLKELMRAAFQASVRASRQDRASPYPQYLGNWSRLSGIEQHLTKGRKV